MMSEWSPEEAEKLLDEARICGINAFTLTGGEPMLHKNFPEIVEGIYKRGMFVNEINTNGAFLTQELLDRLKAVGCAPTIKISFDGLGFHDWLRNRKGAEESALRAIRLSVENGFYTKVQTNVFRANVGSIMPTAKPMDSLGVREMRIIRTTEAPRWELNAKDQTLDIGEYYEKMLGFAREFKRSALRIDTDIWQFLHLYPEEKSYLTHPVICEQGAYRGSAPVCRGNRGMIAIAGDGEVYPCHQLSGVYKALGRRLGNVKKQGLQPLLQKGDYLDEICTTIAQLAENNKQCGACPHFSYCCGGCRAVGTGLTGDRFGTDLWKCVFWNNGWYEKVTEAMSEGEPWRDTRPIR